MIFRRVIDHESCGEGRYTEYDNKSIYLILECGHDQYRKASMGVPDRARCRDWTIHTEFGQHQPEW